MTRSISSAPNLLTHLDSSRGSGSGAPLWGKILLCVFAGGIVGGVVYSAQLVTKVSDALAGATNTPHGLFAQIRGFTAPADKLLRGEERDRINVALLGIGGEGHEGSQLTDTMIVASFQPSTNAAGLFSIPRDLVVEIPGYGFRKINHANAFGEDQGEPGDGITLTTTVLTTMLKAPIDYYVRVDFAGFEQFIDDIGGIDVTIERSFVDYEYPTEDFGYQTIRFDAGRHRFDGATALKYVRSRHGNNGEGSDFARSKRQQNVLIAVKERVFSLDTLLNPSRIANAIGTLGEHIRMNFEPWELLKLARLGQHTNPEHVVTKVLDTTPEGLLVNETGLDGAYILEPRVRNFSEVQAAFANLLTTQTVEEHARVEIQNGTSRAGLAARTATTLEALNTTVVRVRNADVRTHAQTIIYDLTGGKKNTALARMKTSLRAVVATSLSDANTGDVSDLGISDIGSSLTNGETLRQLQTNTTYADIDFVIILGADQVDGL